MFMPSREIHAGEYRDICFPITSELYKQIKDSVLEAYERPEDDDPAYGDNPEMAEKAEQAGEVPASAAGQGRRGTVRTERPVSRHKNKMPGGSHPAGCGR